MKDQNKFSLFFVGIVAVVAIVVMVLDSETISGAVVSANSCQGDTDQGVFTEPGVVTTISGEKLFDACIDGRFLQELDCKKGALVVRKIDCSANLRVCKDGACVGTSVLG